MDMLKCYRDRVAKVVFAQMMSKETFDARGYITYAFRCSSDIASTLSPGDFVIVEAAGLCVGVFVEFSNKISDRRIATKHVICKVPGYTVESRS